jgi:hypothetical protein
VAVFLDVVLALAEGIPELDRAITRTRDDLTIVRAEAYGEHVGGVTDKAAGGETSVKVPETKGMVPRRRECELAVRGDDNVGHEVVMTLEDPLGVAVRVLVARELPYNDRLVLRLPVSLSWPGLREAGDAPRDAVKIMSGFSDDVAMAVTQPWWPGNDPRKRRLSISSDAMKGEFGGWAAVREVKGASARWD